MHRAMKRRAETLSFYDHMDELRGRLIKSFLSMGLFSIIAYQYKDRLLAFLIKPVGALVFTSPSDAFVIQLGLSLFAGFLMALPIILYQVWKFVEIALKEQERKFIRIFAPFSVVLFLAGVCFAYYVVVPFSMKFLLSFANEWLVPMITVKNYLSFVVTMVFGCGVTFEFPLVIMFLTKIGIASPQFLIQKRRHAIVLIFIVSAIITPPDVITMWIVAIPLLILYEVSIIAAKALYQPDFVPNNS